ncbi:hypothetical protein PENTCL1PPCAC_20259, partial [Pristionchus entomophagus]
GAHQPSKDFCKWSWIDGEVPIDGKTYSNFVSAFPIPGIGNCSAMLTDSSSALWINEDCKDDALPFICRRIEYSTVPKDCPMDAPKAGEDIFSPGLHNSDVPCEYMLFVSANKLVELEVDNVIRFNYSNRFKIMTLVAAMNQDISLTGTINTPTKLKTDKTNVLRVNWKPNGTGSGRGFRV